jgi:hypothetical protein
MRLRNRVNDVAFPTQLIWPTHHVTLNYSQGPPPTLDQFTHP